MRLKLRILQAATALLYMGPLLAGLAGFGWWMVPPFVSIFVLWLALLRPHQWPQSNAEWLSGRAVLAAAGQILSQVLLVAVCFGIGRGLGGVLGYVPVFHPILPVALSFAAVPLLRLFWDTDRALSEGLVIDELLYPHSAPPPVRATAPDAGLAVAHLLDLADDADPQDVRAALEDGIEAPDSWLRLSDLADALASAPPSRHLALRRALTDWATDDLETFGGCDVPGALRAAFAAAGSDDDLLRGLLPRARALLQSAPDRANQFPAPGVIDDMARRSASADVAAALADLAGALRGAIRSPAPVRQRAKQRPTAARALHAGTAARA